MKRGVVMDYKEIFAKRLKKERQAKGKTQKDMAIALDITRESYLAYEHGIATPKFENLMRIHEELNISIDYLVGITDDKRGIGYADSIRDGININQQNNNGNNNVTINKK